MNKPDKEVIIILILCIAIFLLAGIAGLVKHKLPLYISYLNGVSGLAVIIYWLQHELSITQHFADIGEISMLCTEGLVVGLSAYVIFSISTPWAVTVLQYIFFGLHLLALVLFLVFMLTFKITKLF